MAAPNPFTESEPVEPANFVGRGEAKELIWRHWLNAADHPRFVFISGEPGLGKTSLARWFVAQERDKEDRPISGREIPCGDIKGDAKDSFEKLMDRMADAALVHPVWRWRRWLERLKSINLWIAKVDGEKPHQGHVRLAPKAPTIVAIDELDGLAADPRFASWIKAVADARLRPRLNFPILFLLCGTTSVYDALIRAHPSLDRVLTPCPLELWRAGETRQFFEVVLRRHNVRIDQTALDNFVVFSGGHCHLAQLLGHHAWEAMTDRCEAKGQHSTTDRTISFLDGTAAVERAAKDAYGRFVRTRLGTRLRDPVWGPLWHRLAQDWSKEIQAEALRAEGFRLTDEEWEEFWEDAKGTGVLAPAGPGLWVWQSQLTGLAITLSVPEPQPSPPTNAAKS